MLKVYKSKTDPVSAVLICNGAKAADGKPVDVVLIDSDLHVDTRLTLREQLSARNQQNQTATFGRTC